MEQNTLWVWRPGSPNNMCSPVYHTAHPSMQGPALPSCCAAESPRGALCTSPSEALTKTWRSISKGGEGAGGLI